MNTEKKLNQNPFYAGKEVPGTGIVVGGDEVAIDEQFFSQPQKEIAVDTNIEKESEKLSAATVRFRLRIELSVIAQDTEHIAQPLKDELATMLRRYRAKLDQTTLPEEVLVVGPYTIEVIVITELGKEKKQAILKIELGQIHQQQGGIALIEDQSDDFGGKLFIKSVEE